MQLLAVATLAVSLSDSDAAVSGGDVVLPAVPGSRAAGGGGVAEADGMYHKGLVLHVC